jgi:hypothetical protein
LVKNAKTTPRDPKVIVLEKNQHIGQVLDELNTTIPKESGDLKKFSDLIKVNYYNFRIMVQKRVSS